MQIFIPDERGFEASLRSLDVKRLCSQRREAATVIRMLENPVRQRQTGKWYRLPWLNSPLAQMWAPYIPALKQYYNLTLDLWEERGYRNIILQRHFVPAPVVMPAWWGGPVHVAHRQMLFQKNPSFYNQWAHVSTDHPIYVRAT